MTHAYCPAKHAGTPAHTCLCYHQTGHHGGHECRCGHYWGINWNAMTYDEQWRFLGLPNVKQWIVRDLVTREITRRFRKRWNIPLIGEAS